MDNRTGTGTDTATFLELALTLPVADVRTPSEFMAGHIPGAVNIPLFEDSERETVGIMYKRSGRTKAILRGLELTGPSLRQKLEKALEVSGGKKLLVHCWRGGMRSEAMAWLFSLGGIETIVLRGGYKAYRHHIIEYLSVPRRMIILGGLTGSGKTRILANIRSRGHRVIDLEGLANHKGSAFGSLGQPPQPSSEHFANLLYHDLTGGSSDMPLWLEDESRNIGNVFMHEGFFLRMQENPVIVLMMDIKTRLPRLLEEYSDCPRDELISSVMKISRRLGGDRTKDAVDAIRKNDFAKAIEITLQYYDKSYLYSLGKKNRKDTYYVNTDTDDIETNTDKILGTAEKLKW